MMNEIELMMRIALQKLNFSLKPNCHLELGLTFKNTVCIQVQTVADAL